MSYSVQAVAAFPHKNRMDPVVPFSVTRRDFLYTSIAGAGAVAFAAPDSLLAQADQESVVAQIARQHDATVQMLREWNAVPSLAAENLNYPQGPEHMARFPGGRVHAGGRGRAAQMRRHHHSARQPGSRWLRPGKSGIQGRHRARARIVRREVGTRADARRAFELRSAD